MAPQVLVIGLGALGSVYTVALTKAGAQVTAVCRSNYEHVNEHGLDFRSDKFGNHPNFKPHRVVRSPEVMGQLRSKQ